MTAIQAKLRLIPARNPPGPQCQIKHLTVSLVPLSRQKNIWRLKLGNWEDNGALLCCFNNSRLNICIFFTISYHLSLLFSLCLSPRLSFPSISISVLVCLSVSLWRCIFKDLCLLMLCQKWIHCTGGRFEESVVVGGCGAFRSGLQ